MSYSPLVTTQWLNDHLNDAKLRIVDIRGHVLPATEPPPHYFAHHEAYVDSHIPGAVFVDWVTDITDPDSPKAAQIARPDAYAALMNRLGIGQDAFVVAYDDAQGMFAARLWWSLNYYGHRQAAVLDGGWDKWLAEGRPVTAEIRQAAPAVFTARPDPRWRWTIDQVAEADDSVRLVDVRSPEEYAGRASRVSRFGHIPGAVNLPRPRLINADGTLRSPEELRRLFASAGVDESTAQIVTYCNAGVSSSFALLALRVAGFTRAAVYDGSWKEWGSDETRPIE